MLHFNVPSGFSAFAKTGRGIVAPAQRVLANADTAEFTTCEGDLASRVSRLVGWPLLFVAVGLIGAVAIF